MLKMQWNKQKINELKETILYRKYTHTQLKGADRKEGTYDSVPTVPLLLMLHYLFENDPEINASNIKCFLKKETKINVITLYENLPNSHPINRLLGENVRFLDILHKFGQRIEEPTGDFDEESKRELTNLIRQLGQVHIHFHVKEKLIFPLLERYGHIEPTRVSWRKDDQIRSLYGAMKKLLLTIERREIKDLRVLFCKFQQSLQSMIFLEEYLIFPILLELFTDDEWRQVAEESTAYGYTYKGNSLGENKQRSGRKTDPYKEGKLKQNKTKDADLDSENSNDQPTSFTSDKHRNDESIITTRNTGNIRFGGGLLTIEEADLILNHLPVEITFVDKNSMFKYFNKRSSAEDMILIRTPLSIGRNVANCHPPKSLKKVMTIIRDLKAKKRTTEEMWFKKGDALIHITYKAIFNDRDEFIGILEYVQDITSFLHLPKEEKRGISSL